MGMPGWARFGMLASGAWLVGAIIGQAYGDVRIARFLRYSAFEVCDYINYHLCHCGNCWQNLMNVAAFVDHPFINLALIAAAPIVLAWSCAYAALRISHLVAG